MPSNGYRKCAAQYKDNIQKATGTFRPAKQCGNRALANGVYCKKHSGMTGVVLPHVRTPEHIEKMKAGRKRWFDAIMRAKAAGLDVKTPTPFTEGNKLASKAHKKIVREREAPPVDVVKRPLAVLRAQKVLVSEIASLPALPDKPFDQMEPHEQLTSLTGLGMGILHHVLTRAIDPEGTPLLFKAQMTAASTALSVRVKVDRNMLVAKRADKLVELVERLKSEKLIEG